MDFNVRRMRSFWRDENGLGTLEVLLIVAVLVIIAIAFRKWIFKWIEKVFEESNGQLNNTGSLTQCADPSKSPPGC